MNILKQTEYQFKNIIRDTGFLFWVMVFPLILAVFFSLAFSGLKGTENSIKIPVAVEKGSMFSLAAPGIEILEIKEVAPHDADKALLDGSIKAYVDKDMNMKVSGSGRDETIVRNILNQVKQMVFLKVIPENTGSGDKYFETMDVKVNPWEIPSLSLIAMACQYSSFSGIYVVSLILANQNSLGARLSITPQRKASTLIPGMIIVFFITLISNIILILFQGWVLKSVSITDFLRTLLLMSCGNLLGLSLGIFIGGATTYGENMKISFANGIMLVSAFLAGMMSPDIKFAAEKVIPALKFLNPNSVISTEVLKINALGKYDTFITSCLIILLMAVVIFTASLVFIGRKRYDSI